MGWKINGVPHTGQILTVGPSGRDFTHPQDAYAAAEDGALLLVDPGSYALKGDPVQGPYQRFLANSKRIYIRGLGEAATDTEFLNDYYYTTLAFAFNNGGLENIYIRHTQNWGSTTLCQFNSGAAHIFFSRCRMYLYSGGVVQPLIRSNWISNFSGRLLFKNCSLYSYYSHFCGTSDSAPQYYLDLSIIHIDRCYLYPSAGKRWTKNDFALADYVTAPTEGYGDNYGDFLITEGGGTIAAKEQHYRRLRNG